VSELPQSSDPVTTSEKGTSSRKTWQALALLLALLVYPLVAVIYLKSTNGWVFINPSVYVAGVACCAVFAVLVIYLMRGRGSARFSGALVGTFITFPVLLLMLFPLVCLAPLRIVHTFLPKQEVVNPLQVRWVPVCGKRRSGLSWSGVKFVEGFGFLNDNNCKLPSWLVEQLREGDELSGVLQGSCRVSRVFKLLFSLPAGPSLG
jgi:nitrate reductase NapE component